MKDAIAPYNHTKFIYRRIVSEFLRYGGTDENIYKLLPEYEKVSKKKQDERDKSPYILTRTRCINDCIESWINTIPSSHEYTPQIIFIGSGYDTRSYYLSFLSSAHVFEIDTYSTISHKNTILSVCFNLFT